VHRPRDVEETGAIAASRAAPRPARCDPARGALHRWRTELPEDRAMVTASRFLARLFTVLALASGAGAARGADSAPSKPVDPDLAAARKALEAKDWPGAAKLLEKAAARDASNPDVYTLLGFAERNRGNTDAAFAHYEKALRLDPKHLGAHEYVGEAYLMVGNLAKAEEHLKALDKLCFFSCEEYRDLKRSIAEYKQKHADAR
jgi:tetratricopeptide (TPR) repeat protein